MDYGGLINASKYKHPVEIFISPGSIPAHLQTNTGTTSIAIFIGTGFIPAKIPQIQEKTTQTQVQKHRHRKEEENHKHTSTLENTEMQTIKVFISPGLIPAL